MKIGTDLEIAFWLTGDEAPRVLAGVEAVCCQAFSQIEETNGVVCGPVTFITKRPGDDRVPTVPDRVQGPDVRLLVAGTTVVAERPAALRPSFLADLDPVDLARLRILTREAHRRSRPGSPALTDGECDAVIEQIGPESAAATVRGAVDSRAVH